MAIAAHDDEIALASAACESRASATSILPSVIALDVHVESMPGEVLAHVGAFGISSCLPRSLATITNSTLPGALKQRHCVGDGACRLPAAVPAYHHSVELERSFLDVGNDDHRPAGFEQRALGNQLLDGAFPARPGRRWRDRSVARSGRILAGAGELAVQLEHLRGKASPSGRRMKQLMAALAAASLSRCCVSITSARDIASRRHRYDRVKDKRDAGEVGVQRRWRQRRHNPRRRRHFRRRSD